MFKKIILKNKQIFLLLISYTILHIFFYTNPFIHIFFWLSFFIFFDYQDFHLPKKKEINFTFTISIVFFIFYLASGIAFGFHNISFHDSFIHILISLVGIVFTIVGMEILRFKLMNSNKDYFKMSVLIILISEIDFKTLFLSQDISYLHYFVSRMIPLVAKNILYTYLSFNTHYDVPIIIRMFDEVPKLFLLNSNWFLLGAFDLIQVFIIYYLFKSFIFKKKTMTHFTRLNEVLYPVTIITSILFVLFMFGLFSYQPIVILSNSMNPTFQRGDVVIYKKEEPIMPGDIIVFQYQNQNIVHRVIGINEYYVTKGDANNHVDSIKIKKEDIKGVYQFSIKYVGYPSIWLNELFTKES